MSNNQNDFFDELFEGEDPPQKPKKPAWLTDEVLRELEWRRKYEKHLKSAKWKELRKTLFRMRGKKCEECDCTDNLDIHHLTYERLGNERLSDLKILCAPCHRKADKKREQEVEANRENRAYDNAFNTWFRKKNGIDAGYATEGDWEEFEEWLEMKREYGD